MFAMEVQDELNEWPESSERTREWVRPQQCVPCSPPAAPERRALLLVFRLRRFDPYG